MINAYNNWVKYPQNTPEEEGWYRVVTEENGFEGCRHHVPQILFYENEYGFEEEKNVVAFVPEVIYNFDPPPSEFFENDFRLPVIEQCLRQINNYIAEEEEMSIENGIDGCSLGYSFPSGTSKKEIFKVLGIVEEAMKGCYLSFDGGYSFILQWKRK